MSEINPQELVENVTYEVEAAEVIPTPIDPTLSIAGEAADAKATGDAIAAVFNGATVNGKAAVNKAFTVYSTDVRMTGETGAPTVAEAIEAMGDKTADDIVYDPDNLQTVKGALDSINEALETEITTEEIDEIFEDVYGGNE